MKRIMLLLLGLATVTSGTFVMATPEMPTTATPSGKIPSSGEDDSGESATTAATENWMSRTGKNARNFAEGGRKYFSSGEDGRVSESKWKRGLRGTGRSLDAVGTTANVGFLANDLIKGQDSLLNEDGLTMALMRAIKQEAAARRIQQWFKGSRVKNAGLSVAKAALVEALLSQLSEPGMYNGKGRRSAFSLAKDGAVASFGYAKKKMEK